VVGDSPFDVRELAAKRFEERGIEERRAEGNVRNAGPPISAEHLPELVAIHDGLCNGCYAVIVKYLCEV
jgi:hypothetical protein